MLHWCRNWRINVQSSGGSSLRRLCCIFIIQANEQVLNSTDCCKKVHTLPILYVYLIPYITVYTYCNLVFFHINLRVIVEGADLHDVARQKRITSTGVSCRAVKVLLHPQSGFYCRWMWILDNVTSEAGSEPCIKDDERKANVKQSPMKREQQCTLI